MTQPSSERRFPVFDDEDELPARRPWWIAGSVVAAGIVALVIVLVVHHGGGSSTLLVRQLPQPKLPAGARPLPGELPVQVTTLGVVGQVDPSTVAISRAAALRAYDRIAGHTTRGGRKVLTSVARIAFIHDGKVQTRNYWVVSVWWHPYDSAGPFTWEIDDGLIDAATGKADYNVVYWPPPGLHPRAA